MKFLFTFILLFLPSQLLAAEFFMDTSLVSPKVGEEFIVTLNVNTLKEANVLAGEVHFDETALELKQITFGNSIVNFWIDRPNERQPGEVSYSGLVVGGFNRTKAAVLSLHYKAIKSGETTLTLNKTEILAHDGLGTQIDHEVRPLTLSLEEGIPSVNSENTDIDPPLPFVPVTVRQDDLFDGKHILIFDTSDKGTGVDAYYIKEYAFDFLEPFTAWRPVASPYVLEDQSLGSYVLIKAVDKAGNYELATVSPTNPKSQILIWIPLLILVLIFYFGLVKRRKIEKRVILQ